VNGNNVTIEQISRLRENHSQSTMKISDGQFKMRAVFNNDLFVLTDLSGFQPLKMDFLNREI